METEEAQSAMTQQAILAVVFGIAIVLIAAVAMVLILGWITF